MSAHWYRGPTAIVTLVAACALSTPATAATSRHADVMHSRVAPAAGSQSASAVVRYWTVARMRKAIPIERTLGAPRVGAGGVATPARGKPGRSAPAARPALLDGALARPAVPLFGPTAAEWPGPFTSPPAITSGKVFFTADNGQNYTCSASTINSVSKNVVFTAGHCLHGGGQGRTWARNWAFVPAYRNGSRPYGTWTRRQLWATGQWIASGDRTYDIGAAVMNTDGSGRHIVNVVGGQGIEWNYPLVQFVYQFGYPSGPPFNGETLQYCTGTTYSDGGHEGINCNMTEGASGGPWLDNFNGTFGWLDSVNSWVFWNAAGVRYKWNGPYFGNAARDLFNAVAGL
jgi:V8-like Glu-specific endopeptidase